MGNSEAFEAHAAPEAGHQSPLDLLLKQGVSWGGGDILCLGRAGVYERLAEVAAILLCLHNEAGERVAKAIQLVLPPFRAEDHEWRREFERAFRQKLVGLTGQNLDEATLDSALRTIGIRRFADFSTSTLLELIDTAAPRTALLVAEAAAYRKEGLATDERGITIPEDYWVPHLAGLAAEIADGAREVYLYLETGEYAPARPENLALLCGIEPFGVITAEPDGTRDLEMVARAERWLDLIAKGALGVATAEINTLDLSDQRKTLMRLQLFNEAGLSGHVLATLRTEPALLKGLSPRESVMVARMAEAADADEIAVKLLREALPQLDRLELQEAGLLIAEQTQDMQLRAAFEAALDRMFPASSALLRLRVQRLAATGEYRRAAELCECDADLEVVARFYAFLAERLESENLSKAILDEALTRFPDFAEEARIAVAKALERRRRRHEAIELLLESGGEPPSRAAIFEMIGLLERGLLSDDAELDDELSAEVIIAAAGRLAAAPSDGMLRLKLTRLLRPELLGLRAPALMVGLLLERLKDGITITPTARLNERPAGLEEKEGTALFRKVAKWLAREGVSVLGRRLYPTELLGVDPERAVVTLEGLVSLASSRLDKEDELTTFELILAVAAAVAPHAKSGVADLNILRLAAAKYVLAGYTQRARDLAEHMLLLPGDDLSRKRSAWFGFADTYARLRNNNEALLGLFCAFSTGGSANWDQIWYETSLVFRLLRDHGAVVLGKRVLPTARQALEAIGGLERYGHRLAFMETQVALAEYQAEGSANKAVMSALIERAVEIAQGGVDRPEESPSAATLLAQVLRIARDQGIEPPEAASKALAALVAHSSDRVRPLLNAVSAIHPSAESVAALAGQLDAPRHAEDMGFDLYALSIMARRLLDGEEGVKPEVALFAGELLTDHAINLFTLDGSPHASTLPNRLDAPLELARSAASSGYDVVSLALGELGLTRTVVKANGRFGTVREPPEVFSPEAFKRWRETFPYDYRDNRDLNVFYTSTEAIGVSELPEKAALVMSTDLQCYPPNLLRIGEALAGRTHRLASVPSLAWLTAARSAPPRLPRRLAWIPDAIPDQGLPMLQTVADDLRPFFTSHGVALATGRLPPSDAAGAELVVVAAHGALVSGEQRFFRSIHDDVDVAIAGSALSGALTSVGVAVLFVCSGGRVDAHPGAATTIGLVKTLLDGGCSAVIAPPWPLYVGVPRCWVPTFLDAWSDGQTVVDACFEANQAVLAQLGDDPARWLAMSVYGDPAFRSSIRPAD